MQSKFKTNTKWNTDPGMGYDLADFLVSEKIGGSSHAASN